ncbi:galactose-1-phosphate uridylyltransferase [Demetria terragena]|uniref:galactose-1-phosphate uridylyltransferase n=1 Tax=Demetria terragena TaxID=63959 RepID=UPI000381D976|nr:galactose-1-phosphate uridylyltransferase [Demetria terragena]
MHRTNGLLADGREIVWYDIDGTARVAPRDERDLPSTYPDSQMRCDPLTGDWIAVASHRQTRTFMPSASECPLCPSKDGWLSEVPSRDYEVVVFENRFPSFSTHSQPAPTVETPLQQTSAGLGRCEVVCFGSDHNASFADLSPERARLILDAWADRTHALSQIDTIEYVYPFENRGAEIGVTLQHPHGQIYGYPYVPHVASRELASAEAYAAEHGRNLFGDIIESERRDGARVIAQTEEWIAFLPFASRWPIEIHVYPLRRVRDLPELDTAQRDDFAHLYLDLLGRLDRLYSQPTPYISGWQQAPVRQHREEAWLHLELLSVRRAEGKVKFLAGSESGQGGWVNDGQPEQLAERLRSL